MSASIGPCLAAQPADTQMNRGVCTAYCSCNSGTVPEAKCDGEQTAWPKIPA